MQKDNDDRNGLFTHYEATVRCCHYQLRIILCFGIKLTRTEKSEQLVGKVSENEIPPYCHGRVRIGHECRKASNRSIFEEVFILERL